MATSWTNESASSAPTWSGQSKNSATWTNQDDAATVGLEAGAPIGLLLALTYSQTQEVLENNWSNQTKN